MGEKSGEFIGFLKRYQEMLDLFGIHTSLKEKEGGVDLLFEGSREDIFFSHQQDLPLNLDIGDLLLEKAWDLLFGYHIFVDGSYREGQVGYGFLILKDGQLLKEEGGSVRGQLLTSSNQVGGELMAVEEALKFCEEEGIEWVTIHCDLEAIIFWANGSYKASIPLTRRFKSIIDDSKIEITWEKVEAHSGHPFNERADALAKEGALMGEKKEIPEGLRNLEERMEAFALFLQMKGLLVQSKGIFNQQVAKILLENQDERWGHFNLYFTKRDPCLPRYHELKEEWQERVASYWEEFLGEETKN